VALRLHGHGPGLSRRHGAHLAPSKGHDLLLPLSVALVVVALPLVVLLSTVVVLGWQLQVVQTGSMAPLYPQGSLAVVQPLDPSDIRAGMPVVFHDRQQGHLVAHRVVGPQPGMPATWRTKGDANRTEDPLPVRASDVRGRVRWAVPRLGRVGLWLRGEQARWLLIAAPLSALVLTEVRGRRAPRVRSARHALT
jgi:signal peptidase I